MSRKSKGINAERDLIHKFWGNGWGSIRVAGSGSMKYPSADILASNKLRILAIECKTSREHNKYFDREEIKQLTDFSSMFNAEPWIAIRFDREEWYFMRLENLDDTGTHYSLSLETAKQKGILFDDLIQKS